MGLDDIMDMCASKEEQVYHNPDALKYLDKEWLEEHFIGDTAEDKLKSIVDMAKATDCLPDTIIRKLSEFEIIGMRTFREIDEVRAKNRGSNILWM